jgi:hypothetical protein
LSQADYRALREGRELPAKDKSSEVPPPADAAAAAESAAVTEPADTPEAEARPEIEKPKGPPKRSLVDEVQLLRARTRELEAKLQAPKPATPPPVETPPPADDPEPEAEKFTDYIEWQKAWTRWDRRQDQKQQAIEAAKRAAAETERSKAATWNERVNAAKAVKPDFETIALNPDLPVTVVMGEAISDSEIGADILYHLGTHPDEAARIAKLPPVAQVREIGKLEFQLVKPLVTDDDEDETPRQPAIAVSKAPAPVARPSAGAPKPNPIRNLEGMTQAEYRAYRESGKIR